MDFVSSSRLATQECDPTDVAAEETRMSKFEFDSKLEEARTEGYLQATRDFAPPPLTQGEFWFGIFLLVGGMASLFFAGAASAIMFFNL